MNNRNVPVQLTPHLQLSCIAGATNLGEVLDTVVLKLVSSVDDGTVVQYSSADHALKGTAKPITWLRAVHRIGDPGWFSWI